MRRYISHSKISTVFIAPSKSGCINYKFICPTIVFCSCFNSPNVASMPHFSLRIRTNYSECLSGIEPSRFLFSRCMHAHDWNKHRQVHINWKVLIYSHVCIVHLVKRLETFFLRYFLESLDLTTRVNISLRVNHKQWVKT